MSGDLEDAFKALSMDNLLGLFFIDYAIYYLFKSYNNFFLLVLSARNRPEYFADRLYSSMKGMGTNDSKLIRVVASRSEVSQ